ncbi:hypothetical protein J6590_013352 [Homalodisca vitripennis]|nr:hypothetical protein J6590_013352 [Homalodisca vitripennis]
MSRNRQTLCLLQTNSDGKEVRKVQYRSVRALSCGFARITTSMFAIYFTLVTSTSREQRPKIFKEYHILLQRGASCSSRNPGNSITCTRQKLTATLPHGGRGGVYTRVGYPQALSPSFSYLRS